MGPITTGHRLWLSLRPKSTTLWPCGSYACLMEPEDGMATNTTELYGTLTL